MSTDLSSGPRTWISRRALARPRSGEGVWARGRNASAMVLDAHFVRWAHRRRRDGPDTPGLRVGRRETVPGGRSFNAGFRYDGDRLRRFTVVEMSHAG